VEQPLAIVVVDVKVNLEDVIKEFITIKYKKKKKKKKSKKKKKKKKKKWKNEKLKK